MFNLFIHIQSTTTFYIFIGFYVTLLHKDMLLHVYVCVCICIWYLYKNIDMCQNKLHTSKVIKLHAYVM